VAASPSEAPHPSSPPGRAGKPPRLLWVILIVNLVQVAALAAVTAAYVVFRWPLFFDAIVAVAFVMVGVALSMTVWALRARGT